MRSALSTTTHVLSFIPPATEDDTEDDRVLARYAADFGSAVWLGYCSSLSVYGEHRGAWVFEDSPLHPQSLRGRRRLQGESRWQDTARRLQLPCAVFRIAGIYGEQRNALERLARGQAHTIVKRSQVFNRVHVEDLVSALEQGLVSRADGLYNVCDDLPASPEDVIRYAARLLQKPVPPSQDFAAACAQGLLSEAAQEFYRESKRASNKRMKEQLGVVLRYPSYREGLESLYASCSART